MVEGKSIFHSSVFPQFFVNFPSIFIITNAQSAGLHSLVAQRTHCSSHKTANAQSWDAQG